MYDWFRIQIPFKSQYVIESDDYRFGVVSLSQHDLGVKLVGEITPDSNSSLYHRSVPPILSRLASMGADNDFLSEVASVSAFLSSRDSLFRGSINRLSHPWESVGSNFGSIAFKVFNDNSCYPCVEIKGSPAKLLQGHNVFGSVNPELCIKEMLMTLLYSNPKLCSFLDFPLAEIREFDVTYSASVPETLHPDLMAFLKNISGGQTRSANNNYDSTCYWGAQRSRHGRRKAYLKFKELLNEISELSRDKSDHSAYRLSVLNDPALQDFARSLLRFEARCKDRVMLRHGIPLNVSKFIKHAASIGYSEFCQKIWLDRFKDILTSIEGQTMNVNNDSQVKEKLRFLFSKIGKNGKLSFTAADSAFATYRNLRRYGWVQISSEMSRPTFYRHLKMICECGISRGFLQNLQGGAPDNVVPLIKLIKVDFSRQVPAWYQEPISSYSANDGGMLKLVR